MVMFMQLESVEELCRYHKSISNFLIICLDGDVFVCVRLVKNWMYLYVYTLLDLSRISNILKIDNQQKVYEPFFINVFLLDKQM